MEHSKAVYLVTHDMVGHWPSWKLSWQLQEDWARLLEPLTEEDARKILFQVWSNGRSTVSPHPSDFATFAAKLWRNHDSDSGGPEPPPFLPPYVCICKSGEPTGAMQIMYGSEKWPLDQREDWMTRYRKEFEKHYGGDWIVVRHPTWSQLRELRHTFIMDARQAGREPVAVAAEPEAKPLADLIPEAYEDVPQVQEGIDDGAVEKHDANRLFEKDPDGKIRF